MPDQSRTHTLLAGAARFVNGLSPGGWPLHPLLLNGCFILLWYRDHASITSPSTPVIAALIALTAILLLLPVLSRAIGNKNSAAIMLSGLSFVFWKHASAGRFIHEQLIPASFLSAGVQIRHVYVALASAALFGLRRGRFQFERLTRYINATAGLIAVVTLMEAVARPARSPLLLSHPNRTPGYTSPRPASVSIDRDIYILILDSLASSSALRDLCGYTNREFVGFLKQAGFHLLPQARANYGNTLASMTSMWRLQYLDSTPGLNPSETSVYLRRRLFESDFFRILEANHYRIHNLSPFDLPEAPAWMRVRGYPEPGSLKTMLDGTLLDRGLDLNPVYYLAEIRNRFHSSVSVPVDGVKQFLYLHFPLPHPPFIFSANGTLRPAAPPMSDVQAYVEQVRFTERLVQEFIMEIQQRPGPEPIILLMSDHGSRLFNGVRGAQEHFEIFAAARIPNVRWEEVPQEISAVNLMRILVNAQFGIGLPLLENRQWQQVDGGFKEVRLWETPPLRGNGQH